MRQSQYNRKFYIYPTLICISLKSEFSEQFQVYRSLAEISQFNFLSKQIAVVE